MRFVQGYMGSNIMVLNVLLLLTVFSRIQRWQYGIMAKIVTERTFENSSDSILFHPITSRARLTGC